MKILTIINILQNNSNLIKKIMIKRLKMKKVILMKMQAFSKKKKLN